MTDFLALAVLVAALSLGAIAPAQAATVNDMTSGSSSSGASAGMVSQQDMHFAETMAIVGMAEVDAGKAAKHATKNDNVEDLAKHMIDDHEKNNKMLKKVAKKLNISLPSDTDAEHKAMIDRLKKADKTTVDKMYLDNEVTAHEKAITVLQDEIQNGQSHELKEFATETLPVIKEHLSLAQNLSKNL